MGNEMICLEVSINGRRLCIAGSEGATVMASVLAADRSDVTVRVTGGKPLEPEELEFLHWMTAGLKVDDEVTVRVVRNDHPDPPRKTERT